MSSRASAVRPYYSHIEGLRGVSALYVVLYHVWQAAVAHPATATLPALLAATPLLQYGHFAVAAFIVISGFCLGLPVAQRADRRFDAKRFFARRARRLMPAYVPVVLLSVVPFVLTALVAGARPNAPHIVVAVGLHLALIHNLFYATTEYLNGPLWSIALECQIYVVFALLLVPLWRRYGPLPQLLAALAIGFAPHVLLHGFDWTVPWLTGLFGMGVVAAHVVARGAARRVPWRALAAAGAVASVAAIAQYRDGVTSDWGTALPDAILGASLAAFFVAAARDENIIAARLLSLRPLVFLGTFSYSLYLIHAPLVDLAGALLVRLHAVPLAAAATWCALIVAIVAAAYGFYRVFERPFLSEGFRRAIDADVERGEQHDAPKVLAAAS